MSYLKEWPRAGAGPGRGVAIPLGGMALVLALLFLGHWRFNSRLGHPPAAQYFDGLPVAGSLQDALRNGFTHCIDFKTRMRCRRSNVMLLGRGPFSAAVDLSGGDGRGGFRQLTLWDDRDPRKASALGRELEYGGWDSCLTMLHHWGDQHILTRPDVPVRISVDLSYYSKRRIRVIPGKQVPPPKCE